MKKTSLVTFAILASACASTPETPKQSPEDLAYPKANVTKTIRPHMIELNACYGATLRRDPKVEGKLVLKFTINNQGQVVNLDPVKESSTVSDNGFINCLRNSIAFWKFPPPPEDNDIEVTYPFQFTNHAGTPALETSEDSN